MLSYHQHRCSCRTSGFALINPDGFSERYQLAVLRAAAAQLAFVLLTLGSSEELSWPAGASFSHVGADSWDTANVGSFLLQNSNKNGLDTHNRTHWPKAPHRCSSRFNNKQPLFFFNSVLCFIAFTVVIAQMGPLNTAGTILLLYPCCVPVPAHWFHRVLFGRLKL